ncbi:hypothetical protein [Parerythrobacter lacustris]|uniref:DUF4760 domain-containing protein n=1 Tax=Parerythrobacter lacustris TaxID=2969984 RepID=A0ABT1XMY3_9SPHN|nr:hypothetical protein [Parerythrobacter lacustris]MCR2833014.1 hypothetical protein [Parerythrobacter lacustris]
MRRFLGFLGSLGVGVMLTASGLVMDANSLIYSGIIIFALMTGLWLWAWARPVEVHVPDTLNASTISAPPPELDEEGRALWTLKSARHAAQVALVRRRTEQLRAAYYECEAAMLTAKRQFGVSTINFTKGRYEAILEIQIEYFDRVIPLLSSGHVDEAKRKARNFINNALKQLNQGED